MNGFHYSSYGWIVPNRLTIALRDALDCKLYDPTPIDEYISEWILAITKDTSYKPYQILKEMVSVEILKHFKNHPESVLRQILWCLILESSKTVPLSESNSDSLNQYLFDKYFIYRFVNYLKSNYQTIERIESIDNLIEDEPSYIVLSPWQKYFIRLKAGYSLKEIAELTKLTYRQIKYEDKKLWNQVSNKI